MRGMAVFLIAVVCPILIGIPLYYKDWTTLAVTGTEILVLLIVVAWNWRFLK